MSPLHQLPEKNSVVQLGHQLQLHNQTVSGREETCLFDGCSTTSDYAAQARDTDVLMSASSDLLDLAEIADVIKADHSGL